MQLGDLCLDCSLQNFIQLTLIYRSEYSANVTAWENYLWNFFGSSFDVCTHLTLWVWFRAFNTGCYSIYICLLLFTNIRHLPSVIYSMKAASMTVLYFNCIPFSRTMFKLGSCRFVDWRISEYFNCLCLVLPSNNECSFKKKKKQNTAFRYSFSPLSSPPTFLLGNSGKLSRTYQMTEFTRKPLWSHMSCLKFCHLN